MAALPDPMDVTIQSDTKNPLLGRREVKFEVSYSGAATPSLKEIRANLAAKLVVSEDVLVVVDYRTSFGVNKSTGTAKIYGKKDDLKTELSQFIKRQFPQAEKPAEKKEGV